MISVVKELFRSGRGATAVEYGLICALVVLGAMAGLTNFGTKAIGMWNNISTEVTSH